MSIIKNHLQFFLILFSYLENELDEMDKKISL